MQFSLVKIVAFIAAAAVTVNGAATPAPASGGVSATPSQSNAKTQDFFVGYFYTNPSYSGTYWGINVKSIPSACFNLVPQANNQLTSFRVSSGFQCYFYTDSGCQGTYFSVRANSAPTVQGTNFDDNVSSYKCVAA